MVQRTLGPKEIQVVIDVLEKEEKDEPKEVSSSGML